MADQGFDTKKNLSNVPIDQRTPFWIVDDEVYDFSEFMYVHPGGKLWFIGNCRRDVSISFHTYHKNPEKLKSVLSKFKVEDPDFDCTPAIMLPPFLLPPDFSAEDDIPKYDFNNRDHLLPKLQQELLKPVHQKNIKFYNNLWQNLCYVAVAAYLTFSISMIFGLLSAWTTVPALVVLRTALAGWGHYFLHTKKPNWGDVFFDINYVGTSLTAFDGHVMLHHAYTQSDADVKTAFFFSMLSLPTMWRIPGYTLHKLGNMLFGNLARGLEIQFMERSIGIWHHSFWFMRALLMIEFWATVFTGQLIVWFAQYLISLWINTFMVLSSHEFEHYKQNGLGTDWGKFQVEQSYDLKVIGWRWIDVFLSAGLSPHRAHHILPYQTSGFANIYSEEPLEKLCRQNEVAWTETKNFWTDRLPIILDFLFNSPQIVPNTGAVKYKRGSGAAEFFKEQFCFDGLRNFAAYVIGGTIGIGAV